VFIHKKITNLLIVAENGSGGWMSDLNFSGGKWGILGGNQQYTVRNAFFLGCANAIGMIWDWGWVRKTMTSVY